jgi:hypothetical protein
MGTRGSFSGDKAAWAWSWTLTSMYCRGQRMCGATLPLPQYALMARFLSLTNCVKKKCVQVNNNNKHDETHFSSTEYPLTVSTMHWGKYSQRGLGIFLFTTASRTALGSTQPPIQWVPGSPFLGVKRSGSEADHSPPSSAEVKRHNFTFTLRLYSIVTTLL